MFTGRRPVLATFVVIALMGLMAAPAAAQPFTTGPVVTLDRTTVSPGEHVFVTMSGFTSTFVTISVCGNEARRGSQDCNMTASEGQKIDGGLLQTVADMPIAEPPVDCPCVIRVSTHDNETIIVPITLVGHPVGPLVDSVELHDVVDVTISARPAGRDIVHRIRPSLGGPEEYEVTVTVTNRAAVPLHHIRLRASAGRSGDDNLAALVFADPGEIGAGQTWRQIISAVVPAPSFGEIEWRVAVVGAGPTVNATDTTSYRPVLLVAAAMLVVINITILGIRWRVRRRIERTVAEALAAIENDVSPEGDLVSTALLGTGANP